MRKIDGACRECGHKRCPEAGKRPTACEVHREEKGWRHYVPLYAHLAPPEYAAKMRAIFMKLRHDAVPPYMRDVLYKTAITGHRMGSIKYPKQPQEAMCHRCGTWHAAFPGHSTHGARYVPCISTW